MTLGASIMVAMGVALALCANREHMAGVRLYGILSAIAGAAVLVHSLVFCGWPE